MAGVLYLVATPIGNLEDITARALRILGEVDLIAAEDTRVSRRLLNHFAIKKPLISYYEQNKQLREAVLLDALLDGQQVALVCDAGTPGLSDPGADICRAAIAHGIEVIAIPGASALLTALTASGLEKGPFCFEGFLPRGRSERRRRVQELASEQRVMVFYEAPHRLLATLQDLTEAFGEQRQAAACRELTKLHEEKRRGTLGELLAYYQQTAPRGEFTLIVQGAPPPESPAVALSTVQAELEQLLAAGQPRKQAARTLAHKYGLPQREVYALGLPEKEIAGR